MWIKFFPGDWVQDTAMLSLAAKGAWIDILSALHRSSTRGEMTLPITGWARLMRCSIDQAKSVIGELVVMRICDSSGEDLLHVTESNSPVTLASRRLKREESERESTRYRVSKHRELKCNGSVTVQKSEVRSQKTEKDKKHFLLDSIEYQLACLLLERILKRNPEYKKPNLQTWAKEIDLMIRTDKRKPDKIRKIIGLAHDDWKPGGAFCWAKNILSVKSLRKQFDQLAAKLCENKGPGGDNEGLLPHERRC